MTWQFQPALSSFEVNRERWDALNAARGDHVLLDSEFVACLLKHFGNENVLLAIREHAPAAMALVEKKSATIWETFQPSQAPLGLILCGQADGTGEVLTSLLRSLPGYALQVSALHQDPDYTSFPPLSGRTQFQSLDYIRTARLPLEGSFETYWSSRGTNLRHNLARRGRRMEEQGIAAELIALRNPDDMADGIREYGRLESSGWKGKNGTAVAEDNAQGKFYREVLEQFCARKEAVIYQYRLNGKVAASDLCLHHNGMMVVLKTAYDEELESFSPALQMRRHILQQIYVEQEVTVVEFYGPVKDWHLRWCDQVRTMYHVNCFRHSWVERVKMAIKRLR
jgi:CelD/BcsL family acetyltransferase involved in cellulose biosynthesis